jgi:hypothetical protein
LLRVAGFELLIICVLGLALYATGCGKETVRTVVERDTTETVRVDTVVIEKEGSEQLEIPEPTLIEEATPDTVVSHDTVYVTQAEPILQYQTPITNPHFTGRITSTVRGELVSQNFDYSLRRLQINRLKTTTVQQKTTHYQRERFRLNAGISIGANREGLTQIAPMIGLERPGRWEAFYAFDMAHQSHQLMIVRPLLSR